MASRLIHLAVADSILREFHIENPGRFRLGSILPDAKNDSCLRAAPHYQTVLPNGLITYELRRYLEEFGEKMSSDSLYLGYYLHLVQDMVYRRFMYALPGWDARIPGNVRRLHSDYRKINRYIIDSRGIENGITAPENFESEPINRAFDFDIVTFLRELDNDFVEIQEGEYHHFTPQMADRFLDEAIEVCRHEMIALRDGLPLYDEIKMAWGKE